VYTVKLIRRLPIAFGKVFGLMAMVASASSNKKTATFEAMLTFVDDVLSET